MTQLSLPDRYWGAVPPPPAPPPSPEPEVLPVLRITVATLTGDILVQDFGLEDGELLAWRSLGDGRAHEVQLSADELHVARATFAFIRAASRAA